MKNALEEQLPRSKTPIREQPENRVAPNRQKPFTSSFRSCLREFKKSGQQMGNLPYKTILLHIRAPDHSLKIKKLAVNDKIFKQVGIRCIF